MGKPEYIKKIEENEGIFSEMDFHRYTSNLIKYLDDKKLTRVYERGLVSSSGKASWAEVIFQSKQKFYLLVECIQVNKEDEYSLTIYYKPEQFQELLFFTTQLLKPFKDGTTDDRATQTENK